MSYLYNKYYIISLYNKLYDNGPRHERVNSFIMVARKGINFWQRRK